jgi:homoserine kinase type II
VSEKKDINKIGRVFGLEGLVLREDLPIAGSPERTEYRVVGESRDGKLFVLEQVASSLIAHKRHMAHVIGLLNSAGFNKAVPYLRDMAQHEHVVEVDGDHWQAVPFVTGVALSRPDYVFDDWRGGVMADVLLKLRTASLSVPECAQKDTFMLPSYIDKLVSVIKTRRPEIS